MLEIDCLLFGRVHVKFVLHVCSYKLLNSLTLKCSMTIEICIFWAVGWASLFVKMFVKLKEYYRGILKQTLLHN